MSGHGQRGARPPIWRRLQIGSAKLRAALRTAVAWEDGHPDEFRVGGRRFGWPEVDLIAHGDERLVRAVAALHAWLLADVAHPLVGAGGGVSLASRASRRLSPAGLAPVPRTRYNVPVRPEDVRAYLGRDWEAVADEKDRFWKAQRERLGVGWAFEVADDLRRQVLALRPGWPSPEEREADIAVHALVSASLRRVRPDGHN